jgi:hypothetical protein
MNSFHLTFTEIETLVPFKFEEVHKPLNTNILNVDKGRLIFESERWLGLCGFSGIFDSVKLVDNEQYLISFKARSFKFTWRDTAVDVYCPGIYRQLSGKNAGRLFYFSYYESWRHNTESYDDVKNSLNTEKRWFLPSYID